MCRGDGFSTADQREDDALKAVAKRFKNNNYTRKAKGKGRLKGICGTK